MRSDNHMNTRRWLLLSALGIGAAAATGSAVVLTRSTDHSGSAAHRPAPGPSGTPGHTKAGTGTHAASTGPHRPSGGSRRKSSGPRPGSVPLEAGLRQTYRLRPVAGEVALGSTVLHPQVRKHAQLTLPGAGRYIALTFDDGPHPDYTPKVLSVLRTYRIQATFFVIGENAAAFPKLLHDIAAGGHVVANHSYTHPLLTSLSTAKIRQELGRTSEVIERVLDAPPLWCRAPYGEWDARSLKVCAQLGMEPLGWSLDTNDWARPGIAKIEKAVTRGVEPGSVILQHDGGGNRSQTVRAISDYLPRLLDKGYVFVRPHT